MLQDHHNAGDGGYLACQTISAQQPFQTSDHGAIKLKVNVPRRSTGGD